MSFYVTLPSNNTSLPDNTQCNYTTIFNQPISLDGEYEVALSEITYSSLVKVDIGEITLNNPLTPKYGEFISLRVRTNNGQKTSEFFSELNELIKKHLILHEYKYRYHLAYDSVECVIEEITNDFNSVAVLKKAEDNYEVLCKSDPNLDKNAVRKSPNRYVFTSLEQVKELLPNKRFLIVQVPEDVNHTPELFERHLAIYEEKILNELHLDLEKKYHSLIEAHSIPTFTVNNSDELLVVYKDEESFKLSGPIAQLLDNKSEILISEPSRFLIVQYLSIINYAAIYTDFIEEQYVGGVQTPILRIINIKSSDAQDTVTFFNNPHYVKVKKTSISSINIRILDLTGNLIKFADLFSFVILKLHFRKL
jgi:hypothetical protein